MRGGYAKVIADSISPDGVRLVTIEGRFRRFVLAEANTHRVISKNSASSRAIPFAKQVEMIREDLAYPEVWATEQKGMQGGAPLSDDDAMAAADIWHAAAEDAIAHAQSLRVLDETEDGGPVAVHKSVVNRLLEPFMWHTACFTATSWQNFFDQRCSPLAQPEIRVFAEAARDAMAESEPQYLTEGEWHLPYFSFDPEHDLYDLSLWMEDNGLDGNSLTEYRAMAARVSAARCARTSYLTHDGKRSIAADMDLYERLTAAQPPHWSPLEHVATPWAQNRQGSILTFTTGEGLGTQTHLVTTDHLPKVGNLLAWRSLRTEVETIQGAVTHR